MNKRTKKQKIMSIGIHKCDLIVLDSKSYIKRLYDDY